MNLNQVTLPSQDLGASIPFYELLGLELIVDSRPRYARFLLPKGQSTLSLHHADKIAGGGMGIQIYFECENLDEEVARLKAAGLNFESPAEDKSWLWREAWLRDPSGHQICLFHAGSNRIDPPWRIGQSSSL